MFCLLFSTSSYLFSQTHSEEELKSVLIIRFCENVGWSKPLGNTLTIGCYSDNEDVYNLLKAVETKVTIQGAELKIVRITQAKEILKCKAVYFDLSNPSVLKATFDLAKHNNILLITANHPELAFGMIDLAKKNDKISYKISTQNLTLAGFSIQPNLLISGGSVVDIKAAYDKIEKQLNENKAKIQTSEKLLDKLERQLTDQDKTIKNKETEIQNLANEIISSQIKSKELVAQNEVEKQNLNQKNIELKNKEVILRKIFQDIDTKTEELNKLKDEIVLLKEESSSLKTEVYKKDEKLNEQFQFISTQNKLIILSLCLIGALSLAAFALTRLFLTKKRLSKSLEEKVSQRTSEIQIKSKQYLSLFENTPSAIAEIDFSKIILLIKARNLDNKDDFMKYIESDPEIVRECLNLITYIGANSAHLQLYKIPEVTDFNKFYASLCNAETLRLLGEEFAYLLDNHSTRSYETVRYDSQGHKMNVLINWVDISELENPYSRVILTTTDVTYLRKIESELIRHQHDLESIVRLRTEEIEKLNDTLQNKNGELNELNAHLENEVNKRTIHLRLKNEQLATYAFKNAHNVRGALARILGLLYLYEIGADVPNTEILDKIEVESKQMDLILQQISNELFENSTDF